MSVIFAPVYEHNISISIAKCNSIMSPSSIEHQAFNANLEDGFIKVVPRASEKHKAGSAHKIVINGGTPEIESR